MRLTAALCSGLLLGCAGGPTWPAKVTSLAGPRAPHGTVDVLPLDLEIWTEPGYDASVDQLRGTAEMKIMNAAIERLGQRGYQVGAMIDWNGDYAGGHALDKPALQATVGTLAHYGTSGFVQAGELAPTHLPVRLGTTTGADATLYVGGWGYVPNHRQSTADKVAEGVAIVLVVGALIVLVSAAASALDDKHDHHTHGHAAPTSHDGYEPSGDGAIAHGNFSRSRGSDHPFVHAAVDVTADVISDVATNLAIDAVTHPDWVDDGALPHDGEQAQMYLEMTLVDNHTGVALWHAHQQFPANAASAEDVERVAKSLLAALPAT